MIFFNRIDFNDPHWRLQRRDRLPGNDPTDLKTETRSCGPSKMKVNYETITARVHRNNWPLCLLYRALIE